MNATTARICSPVAAAWLPAVAVAALLCSVAVAPRGAGAAPELLDRIVAVIDDEVVLWSELNLRLSLELQQQGLLPNPDDLAQHRERTLENMIDEQIVVIKARQDSLEVDYKRVEDLLNAELRRIKDSMEPAEFASMLERTAMSERQLKNRYRKQIRNRMLYEQVLSQLAYRSFITSRDVEAFREVHRDTLPPKISISQINVKVAPTDEVVTQALNKISRIQSDLAAGGEFAELARAFSEHPGTADSGGDLGCFQLGMLDLPGFERAAMELRPGEISDPVRTELGYHLIQMHDKRERELCASHILVRARMTRDDRERAVATLWELRARAEAGEDFAELARVHSQDPESARSGGLWQILGKEQIPPFLAGHLGHLKLGEITEPFLLDDGAHILKINDDVPTLEALVREERMNELMRKLIDDLKSEVHIEKRLDDDFLWDPLNFDGSGSAQGAVGASSRRG